MQANIRVYCAYRFLCMSHKCSIYVLYIKSVMSICWYMVCKFLTEGLLKNGFCRRATLLKDSNMKYEKYKYESEVLKQSNIALKLRLPPWFRKLPNESRTSRKVLKNDLSLSLFLAAGHLTI